MNIGNQHHFIHQTYHVITTWSHLHTPTVLFSYVNAQLRSFTSGYECKLLFVLYWQPVIKSPCQNPVLLLFCFQREQYLNDASRPAYNRREIARRICFLISKRSKQLHVHTMFANNFIRWKSMFHVWMAGCYNDISQSQSYLCEVFLYFRLKPKQNRWVSLFTGKLWIAFDLLL